MTDRQITPLRRLVVQQLESLEAAGVRQIAKPPHQAAAANQDDASDVNVAQQRVNHPSQLRQNSPIHQPVQQPKALLTMEKMTDQETTQRAVSTAPTLQVLRDEVAQCMLCEELASSRTQTVFGVGNPQARLCFLGEAPGADEDRQGEPFVGRAGQLLNKILEACHLQREDVYILNVLKCRPPGNRNPAPGEAQNCRSFLDRQLQLLKPEFICCMGAVAAQNLLATTVAIGRLRGTVHEYQGIHVVCTYHPAYLLRNPSAKRHAWDDMKLLMREMGTPVD